MGQEVEAIYKAGSHTIGKSIGEGKVRETRHRVDYGRGQGRSDARLETMAKFWRAEMKEWQEMDGAGRAGKGRCDRLWNIYDFRMISKRAESKKKVKGRASKIWNAGHSAGIRRRDRR